MPAINIYIPQDLHEAMRAAELSWSTIAQQAFRQALDEQKVRPAYVIVPQRDRFLIDRPAEAGPDDTWFEDCSDDDAEVWGVFRLRPGMSPEWITDFSSLDEARTFVSTKS
jgi:hypothetical protein